MVALHTSVLRLTTIIIALIIFVISFCVLVIICCSFLIHRPADHLKSGRKCARLSGRGLVWTQHTNSRGENAFNAMTLSNQKPPFVFYHHMWVSGFQPGDREMEGGGRPQLPQEGALPSGGKVFHIFVMTMTFQTAEGGRVVALGGR